MSRRRQFGSIRRLGSGRFQVSYWHEGGRLVGETTFATKTEASEHLAMVTADLRRGTWTDPTAGHILLAEYANAWLADRVEIPDLRV